MNFLNEKKTSFLQILFLYFLHVNLVQSILESDSVFMIDGKNHFTSRYCDAMNFEVKVEADSKKIDVVDTDAFKNCSQVTYISLAQNQIRHLNENTFKSNGELTVLNLYCNQLAYISDKLLVPLTKLEYLDISVNPLETIHPILRSNLNHLQWLYLVRIELTQLNTSQVKESLPKLQRIYLGENFFACSTYQKMNISFEVNEIKMDLGYHICDSKFASHNCLDDFTVRYFENQTEKIKNYLESHINDIKKDETSNAGLNYRLTQLQEESSILWWILATLMMCHAVALAIWLAKGSSFPN